jgi:hypothetical protein
MAADDTLAGILTLTDANNDPIDVSDLLESAPLLRRLYAKKSSHGTQHQYLKEITAPGVGFRAVDTGLVNAAGEEEQVTVTLAFLDATVRRDIAKAKASGDVEGYMGKQAEKSIKTAFSHMEKQIIQGTGNEADGFNGLANSVYVDDVGDGMVVLTASGAAGTRNVYLLRVGDDDVALTYATENLEMSEMYRSRGASGAAYTELVIDIDGYFGLQVGSQYSVARIGNLDGSSGNTLTDDLISEAIALAPADRPFNVCVMDRVSHRELQQSRTATNPTGKPSPFPTTVSGPNGEIEIIVTDSLSATNTIATTTTT